MPTLMLYDPQSTYRAAAGVGVLAFVYVAVVSML